MTPIQDIHAEDIKAAHFVYTFGPSKLNGVKLHMKDGSFNLYENDDLAFALAKPENVLEGESLKQSSERTQSDAIRTHRSISIHAWR